MAAPAVQKSAPHNLRRLFLDGFVLQLRPTRFTHYDIEESSGPISKKCPYGMMKNWHTPTWQQRQFTSLFLTIDADCS